jgi:hypothetical protein
MCHFTHTRTQPTLREQAMRESLTRAECSIPRRVTRVSSKAGAGGATTSTSNSQLDAQVGDAMLRMSAPVQQKVMHGAPLPPVRWNNDNVGDDVKPARVVYTNPETGQSS